MHLKAKANTNQMGILLFMIVLFQILCTTNAELFSMFGATLASICSGLLGYGGLRCYMRECCSTNYWISFNKSELQSTLQDHLFGQHIVLATLPLILQGHFQNHSPSKALTLSFHGWTGSGKNYVAKMMAESIYREGLESKFVHLFISTLHFPKRGRKITDIYKLHLVDWIRGNVSLCERSMFIFDEVDKMPVGVMDAIKPFIDYHHQIDGINYRNSIFVFLSNTGSQDITQTLLKHWQEGGKREEINISQLENLILKGAFNENGGLHQSDVIHHNLVDYYIPFLPMEREHVMLCIKAFLRNKSAKITYEIVNYILNSLSFFPEDSKLYSKTGCKRIEQKVNYYIVANQEF